MPQAHNPAAVTRTADLPIGSLQMEVRNFRRDDPPSADGAAAAGGDAPAARFELVFTTGAPVRRYDWSNGRYYLETLVVEGGAINLSRLERGAPLLNTHWAYSLEDQIGVCEQPAIEGGVGTVQAQLSRRESVRGIVQDLEDRVIRNVSVGYGRDAIEMVAPSDENGMWVYRVTRWTPMEVSLVPIPADMDAQVRSADGRLQADPEQRTLRMHPCVMTEVRAAPGATQADASTTTEQHAAALAAAASETPAAGAQAETSRNSQGATMTTTAQQQTNGGGAPAATATDDATRAATEAARQAGATAERERQAGIRAAADAARGTLGDDAHALATRLIDAGVGVDEARRQMLDALAERSNATASRGQARIDTVVDEVETRRAGMAEALAHRLDPNSVKLTDNGGQYRYMSLQRMSEELLAKRNINTRNMSPLEIAGRAMTTGDLPAITSNVANKRLRSAYEATNVTYNRWARRAPNAPNFKSVDVVQVAAAPDLLTVNEHGEFKYGKISDGKETYSVITRGRIINFTRQMVINDDMRALDRMIAGFGASGRRLENRLVYAELTTNAALGNDNVALFHSTHANLAGSGGAISVTTLGAGRAAMRLQKGLQSEELNLVPTYLIAPATQEALAYQYTSANYVSAKPSDTNEFRSGGRTALEPIIEAVLDATSTTAWYLAADPMSVDTVEYMYLDGSEGVYIETEYGFDSDGVKLKARHDFAAKAIDYRGLYKNPGA